MTMTDHRLDRPTRPERELPNHVATSLEDAGTGDAAPAPATAGQVPDLARRLLGDRLLEPITGRRAAIAAIAWVVLVWIGIAVEPPPSDPNAVEPWLVTALGTILLAAVVAAFTGFWLRRRWSMAASLLGSGLLVVSTVACPLSGHHATQVGAWWFVQLACGLGLVTASTLGLRRA
jgi:hypothetical protein